MFKISLLFVAMLLFTVAGAQTFEVTTADGNGAETFLSNDEQGDWASPDSAHGDWDDVKVRNYPGTRMKLAYVRFDKSSVSGNVKDAVIGYYVRWFKGNSSRMDIYGLVNESLDDWDELTTCYNNAPGLVPTTEGIPVGYYDITEDVALVGSAHYSKADSPLGDGIGWYYTHSSDSMDNFINDDTNGLVTFLFVPDENIDADWSMWTKETSDTTAWTLSGEISTAISQDENMIPSTPRLLQNYPNPFNPETTIEFNLEKPGYTTLEIYNTLGQPVATLIDGQMSSGHHQVRFAADEYTSAVYFYKLTSGGFTEVKKMMLLK